MNKKGVTTMQNDMREFKAWIDKKYQEEQAEDRLVELLKKADVNANLKFITDYEDAILDNAEYLIANDVVPVVKCSQCRKRYTTECALWFSQLDDKQYFCGAIHNDDFYCSYGERKDCNDNNL
jgi:hypothetical protein